MSIRQSAVAVEACFEIRLPPQSSLIQGLHVFTSQQLTQKTVMLHDRCFIEGILVASQDYHFSVITKGGLSGSM